MRRSMAAFALLALTAAKPVPPPTGPQPPQATAGQRSFAPIALLFATFDTNGDARLTRAEVAAGAARMWTAADPSGAPSIGLIELGDWAQVWLGDQSAPPGRFDFDADQDDRISAAEFRALFDRRFTAFDTDKDGIVTRAEMLQAAPPSNFRMPKRSGGEPGREPN